MKTSLFFSVLLVVIFFIPAGQISAQEKSPFEDGAVWSLTFIRTEANKTNDYLNGLAQTWVSSMEEAKNEGLIVDYKILQGNAANEDDYDLVLMIENKNMASFDPDKQREAAFDAIQKKVQDKMGDSFKTTVASYENIRNLLGTKVMREIHLKK